MAEKSERIIRVPEQFAKKAHIGSMEKYRALYDRSVSDPDGFWNEQAERITWFKKWKTVSKYDFHTAKIEWFIGGKLNASANCLDQCTTSAVNGQTYAWAITSNPINAASARLWKNT